MHQILVETASFSLLEARRNLLLSVDHVHLELELVHLVLVPLYEQQ